MRPAGRVTTDPWLHFGGTRLAAGTAVGTATSLLRESGPVVYATRLDLYSNVESLYTNISFKDSQYNSRAGVLE